MIVKVHTFEQAQADYILLQLTVLAVVVINSFTFPSHLVSVLSLETSGDISIRSACHCRDLCRDSLQTDSVRWAGRRT